MWSIRHLASHLGGPSPPGDAQLSSGGCRHGCTRLGVCLLCEGLLEEEREGGGREGGRREGGGREE